MPFVLKGGWLKKFRKCGRVRKPACVFVRALMPAAGGEGAAGRPVGGAAAEVEAEWQSKWVNRKERIVAADAGLDAASFRGDRANAALCLTLTTTARPVFLLAASEAERDRWLRGIRALVGERAHAPGGAPPRAPLGVLNADRSPCRSPPLGGGAAAAAAAGGTSPSQEGGISVPEELRLRTIPRPSPVAATERLGAAAERLAAADGAPSTPPPLPPCPPYRPPPS